MSVAGVGTSTTSSQHAQVDTSVIRCPWCQDEFARNETQIDRHLEGVHLGTLYNCPFECGHSPFTRSTKAKNHGLKCQKVSNGQLHLDF